nr:WYL domain-containing protein [uncultured Pedobacter sp.]
MATNKHAQIRYLALDKCFSNFGRKFNIDDLVEACNVAIYDFTGKQEGIKKRQVYDDITFMESEQGYKIDLKRIKEGRKTYFQYSDKAYTINNSPLNQVEANQIKEVLMTLSRFKGMPQFEWIEGISEKLKSISLLNETKIIDFEQNQFLKGLGYITPLFNAIFNKRVLKITYLSFITKENTVLLIHPYFLKQYNLRWFLFGYNEDYDNISNLALDRIIKLTEVDITYHQNTNIDFDEYFEDIIGVTVPENTKLSRIVIKVKKDLWPYIKTKPIHGSQKVLEIQESCSILELNLFINYEFISLLLSHGDRVQVLEPNILIDKIKGIAENLLKVYS